MAKQVLTGLTHPGTFELEPGFNTVGRNPTNDFRIHDATVSSFHCEIVLNGDVVVVRDLGSTNGTYVNGERAVEATLRPGEILRVGSAELRLDSLPDPATQQVSIPALTPEAVPTPTMLADGYPACLSHPEIHAAYRCTRCRRELCSDCVHVLQLAGGSLRVFCPSCSGHCETLPVPPGITPGQPKKSPLSLLGRLTQTIRIRFK